MTITGLGGQSILAKMVSGGAPPNKVLADDGTLYDTVQAAENAATDTVIIGPGTFNEAVTVDTAGLTVVGSGYNTLIDGGTTGHAIEVDAVDVTIQNLSVQTTAGSGNSYNGISNPSANAGQGLLIKNVRVRDSDDQGIRILNSDSAIISCVAESTDTLGFNISGERSIISSCITESGVGNDGIALNGDGGIAIGNNINSPGDHGITSTGNDCLIGSNRIHNAADNGINLGDTTDQIVFNNRVSGSTNSDIFTADATTPTLDANVTGGAN